MDPITAGLFVAASFTSSLISNKNQSKIENAQIKIQTEQARLQTAEAAYERTKQFRQNLSMNLAISGMGFGGVSGFRGIASQSISDYFSDTAALGRQDMFTELGAISNTAASKSNKFVNDVNAGTSAVSLASQLGLFKNKGLKK